MTVLQRDARRRAPPTFVSVSRAPGRSAPGPMSDRHVRFGRPAVSPARHARRARPSQVTYGRSGRERSALERWGGRVVREVAAARCNCVRAPVLGRRREARQAEHEGCGRGRQPEWRPQRRNATAGRAIERPRPLRIGRTELLVAEENRPESRLSSGNARMRGGGLPRGDRDSSQVPRRADRPLTVGRYGRGRQRMNYSEPEGGKKDHERNLRDRVS